MSTRKKNAEIRDQEEVLPAELPCPYCPTKTQVGRYTHKDWYHCFYCNEDISGIEWAKWRKSGYVKN